MLYISDFSASDVPERNDFDELLLCDPSSLGSK